MPTAEQIKHWAATRIVASMWWCGDEVCDCTQPIVERITPNSEAGYPWIRRERLWEGPFVSLGSYAPEPGDAKEQWRQLLAAAERFGAETAWRDDAVPEELRRPPDRIW